MVKILLKSLIFAIKDMKRINIYETNFNESWKQAEKVFTKIHKKQSGISWNIKSLFIWICLFFVPTYESYDLEDDGIHLSCVTYAKKLFGTIYIMQNDIYKNGCLIERRKLTFKDICNTI